MSAVVYHFTDTGRLPWILRDGVLKPGRNRIGNYPDPDFFWATTSPIGDRTASASVEALRSGLTRSVRFALRAEDFEAWPKVVEQFPAWTPDQVARLERAARGASSPREWRCRVEPLPANPWVGIETRSYTDRTWRPIDPAAKVEALDAETIGIWIEGKIYTSAKVEGPNGATGFRVSVGTLGDAK